MNFFRFSSRLSPRLSSAIRRPTISRSALRAARQTRLASYQRFPGRGGSQYSNFGPFARAQYLWYNYQTPILVVGAAGGTFYVINLEEVPITHRRRFNCISPETEKNLLGKMGYESVLQEFRGKILPENHPYTQMVARVVERLLPSTGGLAGDEWVVHVIDAPKEKNAFVMPGGKVFVFTGILPIAQDEDGLATVLGHEIAHNVAHHAAERLSRGGFLALAAILTSLVFDISGNSAQFIIDLFLSLPNSRTQEAEADRIGLLMMAQSCFNPDAAVEMWRRMAEAEKGAPPQFLSTHPSSHNRMDTIKSWLPEAHQKMRESECGMMSGYASDFRKAFGDRTGGAGSVGSLPTAQSDDDFW